MMPRRMRSMQRIPYKMADEAAAKITKKIHREFRHNRLALFDEMNVTGVKSHVQKLYKNVYKIILDEFTAVLNPLYEEIYDEALALGFDGDIEDLDEAWIEEFFDEYNPVTKYVFSNELGRKESRLFEALVASSAETIGSYKTAENLLARQVKQYAIELEDAVTKAVYKAVGVKKVMWNAEIDHKTCSVCNELDGEIFSLKNAPPKQHYHCRCWFTPVK
jgi:SPP1 gp7 family putative phage head morphogenesis protein